MLIYVIDDEKNSLEDMRNTLSEAIGETAEISAFTHCEDALAAISGGAAPDAVFADIVMPGISGLEFAVKLKELSPAPASFSSRHTRNTPWRRLR